MTKVESIKEQFGIVGRDVALDRAIEMALLAARTDCTLLVCGENGVGKDVFYKIVHSSSSRKKKKSGAVNCGSIPEGTVDSELFGHVKGAFTDAVEDRKGYFEEYDGGTIFLDEIGELPMSTQARLLRVLESGEYYKVGSPVPQKANVRIVAATNVDLVKACAQGKFRQDLYQRLNVVRINVPPLRERKGDIITLFKSFAVNVAEKYNMEEPITLDEEASKALENYSWPGNIRELRHLVESMAITSTTSEITLKILHEYINGENSMLATMQEETPDYNNTFKLLFNVVGQLNTQVEQLTAEVEAMRQALNLAQIPVPQAGITKAPALLADMRHKALAEDGDYIETESEIVAPVSKRAPKIKD